MRRVRTHRFASGVYPVDEGDYDGMIIPKGCEGEICVRQSLKGKRALHAWLHEALHAEFPEISEACIEEADKHIGGFLWRLGYRRKR